MRRLAIVLAIAAVFAFAAHGEARAKCMPIYGNWCGANYPPPGANPPPVDVFDDACRRHDHCYLRFGAANHCDVAFVHELRALAARIGYLPRPLQWAESLLRMKSGGPIGFPMPTPGDMMGAMSSVMTDCGY